MRWVKGATTVTRGDDGARREDDEGLDAGVGADRARRWPRRSPTTASSPTSTSSRTRVRTDPGTALDDAVDPSSTVPGRSEHLGRELDVGVDVGVARAPHRDAALHPAFIDPPTQDRLGRGQLARSLTPAASAGIVRRATRCGDVTRHRARPRPGRSGSTRSARCDDPRDAAPARAGSARTTMIDVLTSWIARSSALASRSSTMRAIEPFFGVERCARSPYGSSTSAVRTVSAAWLSRCAASSRATVLGRSSGVSPGRIRTSPSLSPISSLTRWAAPPMTAWPVPNCSALFDEGQRDVRVGALAQRTSRPRSRRGPPRRPWRARPLRPRRRGRRAPSVVRRGGAGAWASTSASASPRPRPGRRHRLDGSPHSSLAAVFYDAVRERDPVRRVLALRREPARMGPRRAGPARAPLLRRRSTGFAS